MTDSRKHYVSNYFSPQRDAEDNVIGFIDRTERTLDLAYYVITNNKIVAQVIAAHNSGVKVRLLLESSLLHWTSSDDEKLIEAGIELKIIDLPGSGKMHNKFAISDDNAVMTGSFNWTVSAQTKNAENVVIVRIKYAVKEFREEFNRIWNTPLQGQGRSFNDGSG